MADSATVDNNNKMFTAHGVKKLQGVWMMVNNVPSLTYTVDKEDGAEVKGYTTIYEMMKMAYAPDLPHITL